MTVTMIDSVLMRRYNHSTRRLSWVWCDWKKDDFKTTCFVLNLAYRNVVWC